MGEVGSSEQIILIVDRDRRYRREAARALYLAGWDVLEAASGEEALALAAKHELTLALVDTRLIGMTGAELARRLRGLRGDHLPVVLVSDHDRLERPRSLDELLAGVRRRLALADAERAPAPLTP